MNAKQLERASYLAAHAVLSANVSAPHLATPGARRSYAIDAIASKIRSVFELHCSAFDSDDWQGSTLFEVPLPKESSEATSAANNKLQLVMQKLH